MLLKIISILLPIFLIIALGFGYGKIRQPSMRIANQLNMEVFLPALVFSAIANKTFTIHGVSGLAFGGLFIIIGSGLLAYPLARLAGYSAKTFVPTIMFNNSGNIGIPLAVLAWGETALTAAVILFMVENILHFALGPRILDRHTNWLELFKNQVIIASLLGVCFNLSGLTLWSPIAISLKMLGDISVPLLLFSLGVRMTHIKLVDIHMAVVASIFRPLVGVLLAYVAIKILPLPLTPQQESMLIIFGALPPAVLNFLFAEKYRQEPEKVAAIVMLGNLSALLSLPLALYVVLPK